MPESDTITTTSCNDALFVTPYIEDAELKTLSTGDTVKTLYEKQGTDLTDYHRESVV